MNCLDIYPDYEAQAFFHDFKTHVKKQQERETVVTGNTYFNKL